MATCVQTPDVGMVSAGDNLHAPLKKNPWLLIWRMYSLFEASLPTPLAKTVPYPVGFTQTEIVKSPVGKERAELFPTLTYRSVPSKLRALPNLPVVQPGLFISVPCCPYPELSAATVPVPSSDRKSTRLNSSHLV